MPLSVSTFGLGHNEEILAATVQSAFSDLPSQWSLSILWKGKEYWEVTLLDPAGKSHVWHAWRQDEDQSAEAIIDWVQAWVHYSGP